MKKTICLLIGIGLIATNALSAETHEEESHHHKHHVAVFFGNTHDSHNEDAFTVGLDYEYRLTDLIGAGALIDYADGDIESTVVGGGLFIHPWRDLRLLGALGNEHHDGHDEFLVRLGVMYDFFINDWSISPTVDVDLLESGHQNWVYGIALGRGF